MAFDQEFIMLASFCQPCSWLDGFKGGVLSQGCLRELVIKGPRQIDATR